MFVFSLPRAQLEPLANQLLTNMFAILEKPVSEENEYVMKGILFSCFYFCFGSIEIFSHHEELFYFTRWRHSLFDSLFAKIDRQIANGCQKSFSSTFQPLSF